MLYTYLNGPDEEVLVRPLEGVRDIRERRMLTQQELADRAGVSLFTVQRIERGDGSVRPKTGRAVAEALGVGVEDLLDKAQAPLPEFEDERREDLYDVVMAAARRQAVQDRQAANRALESGRPQTYFMRHENEAVPRLLAYPADELAGTLIEMGRRVAQLEQTQAEQSRSEAPEYSALLEEKGFPSKQIAAYLAENERDEEFIRHELEKMSTKDFLEALLASPGLRRIREGYREAGTEPSAAQKESA